ncbi:MAG: DUF2460 domain-containing protein [Alphaproteobacteria bacterium]|nr:DUF2460 domain-containing protein [Alphaproteobacteria bacterium]
MFAEVRFPEDISYGAVGGPQFSTDTIRMQSGKEQRNRNWKQARLRYQVSFSLRTQKQMETLLSFFYARGGRAEGFRFKDWSDYCVCGQVLGTGDGSHRQFQLVKGYGTYQRNVCKPVEGTVKVYVNHQKLVAGYSMDATKGILLLDAPLPPASQLSADFEFDVPVRFNADYLPISMDGKGIFSVKDIELVEVNVE